MRVDRVVVAAAPDEPDDLDIRVPREQADQLAADVPGRPDDPDPNDARRSLAGRTRPGNLARRHRTYDYTG